MRTNVIPNSLAPFGYTFPQSSARLNAQPFDFDVNEERIIARLWERYNRRNAPQPLPIHDIIYRILPEHARRRLRTVGNVRFDGYRYFDRDIQVLSRMVQWLGTNVGRRVMIFDDISHLKGFSLETEFQLKFARLQTQEGSLFLYHRLHVCNEQCCRESTVSGNSCVVKYRKKESHDLALVDSLMIWLGTVQGRDFLRRFHRHKRFAWMKANQARDLHWKKQREMHLQKAASF